MKPNLILSKEPFRVWRHDYKFLPFSFTKTLEDSSFKNLCEAKKYVQENTSANTFGIAIINLANNWSISKIFNSSTWNIAPNRDYLGAIVTTTSALVKSNEVILILMLRDYYIEDQYILVFPIKSNEGLYEIQRIL